MLVCAAYRRLLARDLEVARRARPLVLYHDGGRMAPLLATILAEFATLRGVETGTGGGAGAAAGGGAAAAGVPRLRAEELGATAHLLPPCMRRFHQELAVKHHLKYEGRLLYVLFLKGAGLALRAQERLWEAEFLKAMTIGLRQEAVQLQHPAPVRPGGLAHRQGPLHVPENQRGLWRPVRFHGGRPRRHRPGRMTLPMPLWSLV